MKRKLIVLLAMSALMLGACAKDNTSSVSESSVTPAPSSETTSTPESSEQSSEQSSEVSSEVSSEEESSSEESSSEEPVVIEIHSVTISGIIAPVVGEQAKFDFVVDNEHVSLDMETTAWTYDAGGSEYFFAVQGDEKTFESGTIYGLVLKLVTDDDAKFASDATISIIIDGDPIELEEEDVYWGSSHTTASAEYHFEKLPGKTKLCVMQVSNLPAAEVGGHPASLLGIKVEPSTYVQMLTSESNLYWVYMNGSTSYFFARGGNQDKTFEAGTEYGVCFIVECKNNDEYAFADNLKVTSAYGEVVTAFSNLINKI